MPMSLPLARHGKLSAAMSSQARGIADILLRRKPAAGAALKSAQQAQRCGPLASPKSLPVRRGRARSCRSSRSSSPVRHRGVVAFAVLRSLQRVQRRVPSPRNSPMCGAEEPAAGAAWELCAGSTSRCRPRGRLRGARELALTEEPAAGAATRSSQRCSIVEPQLLQSCAALTLRGARHWRPPLELAPGGTVAHFGGSWASWTTWPFEDGSSSTAAPARPP